MQTPDLFTVTDVVRELEDVVTLQLEPEQRARKAGFLPGQFSMLYLFGHGEVPISISGDPQEQRYFTYSIRGVGSVSNALAAAGCGTKVGVRGPFGSAWPVEHCDDKDVLLIAGGLGIAPLRPLIFTLLARGKHRNLTVLYGCRSPKQVLFDAQLRKLAEQNLLELELTVDYAMPGYLGRVGVVTGLIAQKLANPEQTVVCLCGPEIMLRFAINELKKCNASLDCVYLSLERNMKCAVGWCGRCQFGRTFICKDGPVFKYSAIEDLLSVREL